MFIGYNILYKKSNVSQEYKTYSLIEGTINGKRTYYLLSMDTVNMESNPPYVVLDSTYFNENTIHPHCDVSLNGLNVYYPKKYRDIKPLVEEIKKSSGYEIAGVIGNNNTITDTIE